MSHKFTRRDFLYITAGTLGVAGVGAFIWPFVDQMNPSADVLAVATLPVSLSNIQVGSAKFVIWQNKPVIIQRRTDKMIQSARDIETKHKDKLLGKFQTDQSRALRPEWLVMVGLCTHLGCIPIFNDADNIWHCPCHGSEYDAAGRVIRGPAGDNLAIPPYEFIDDSNVLLGKRA